MLTTTILPVTFQILVPLALLWWQAWARPETFTAWASMATGVAGYLVATAAAGNWDVAPWYTPFVFLLILGAIVWYRAAWIRALPRLPHSNDEWREASNYAGVVITGAALALVAVATRPIRSEGGPIDVATLNLYRELAASLVGLVILVALIRFARTGRVGVTGVA